jgi:hypothetical protein
MIPAAPLDRRTRRLLAAPIRTAASVPGADAYRKHFPASAHLWLLVWHALSASPSLRQTHAMASADPGVWSQLGLPLTGISRSQLTRSSASRPLACAETLLSQLQQQVPAAARRSAWGRVQLVDSTFLTLSAQLASWSQYGRHAPGVRVHTGFNLAAGIPDQLHFTLADTHDVRAFRDRDWSDWRGWTVVIDRGYYAHPGFAELRAAGVSWLCPLHRQARVVVTAAQTGPWPLAPTGETILADETITLGSPNNRSGAVLDEVRRITSRTPTGIVHQLVTDRTDLSPGEVVALYHQRWQIELFFRWLKHQLGVLPPLGYRREAVELTVLLAAIVAVLLVLLARERPPNLSDIAWVRQLGHALFLALLHGDSS